MNHKILKFLSIALLALTPSFAFAKPTVVTSFSILGDITKNIAGDAADVASIIPAGIDAHSFTPKPSDLKKISTADVMIVNGLGFDTWATQAFTASGNKNKLVTITDGLPIIAAEHAEEHGLDHDHGAVDPHVWQNPILIKSAVDNIAAALTAASPENAATYTANATAYKAKLDELNTWVTAQMTALPADNRTFITSHQAFGYYAAAYGVTFLAPHGLSTDDEATPKDIEALIILIKSKNIKTLHPETESNNKLLETLAQDTGATIGARLYADALTQSGGDAATYIDLIRHNTSALTAGFTNNN